MLLLAWWYVSEECRRSSSRHSIRRLGCTEVRRTVVKDFLSSTDLIVRRKFAAEVDSLLNVNGPSDREWHGESLLVMKVKTTTSADV